MNNKTNSFAPAYSTPDCKTMVVKSLGVLCSSPMGGSGQAADETDYGEY